MPDRLLYENYINSNEAKHTKLVHFVTLGAENVRFEFIEISNWNGIFRTFRKRILGNL